MKRRGVKERSEGEERSDELGLTLVIEVDRSKFYDATYDAASQQLQQLPAASHSHLCPRPPRISFCRMSPQQQIYEQKAWPPQDVAADGTSSITDNHRYNYRESKKERSGGKGRGEMSAQMRRALTGRL